MGAPSLTFVGGVLTMAPSFAIARWSADFLSLLISELLRLSVCLVTLVTVVEQPVLSSPRLASLNWVVQAF